MTPTLLKTSLLSTPLPVWLYFRKLQDVHVAGLLRLFNDIRNKKHDV